MLTFTDAYRSYLRAHLPAGTFWTGTAADRFVEALVQASSPLVQFVARLYLDVWPFDALRPMLEDWHEYLYPESCLPIPADDQDLRDKVLLALSAVDVGTPDGMTLRILAEVPLVEVDDLPGPSIVPLSLPASIDDAAQTVEIWYVPGLHDLSTLLCVGRQYAPATAIIRAVTSVGEFRAVAPATEAQHVALHWADMRPVSEVVVERFLLLGGLLESATVAITNEVDAMTLDELFPSLGPTSAIGGQRFEATFRRTWQGQGPIAILPLIDYP